MATRTASRTRQSPPGRLAAYRAKRHFDRTAEPHGGDAPPAGAFSGQTVAGRRWVRGANEEDTHGSL